LSIELGSGIPFTLDIMIMPVLFVYETFVWGKGLWDAKKRLALMWERLCIANST